ncbi:MAG TPA: hypothetical protein VK140_14790 [Ktedonobacteraceae bacterium]|nr:hypothetical protein [Ktedonobacteraceae bacterium]
MAAGRESRGEEPGRGQAIACGQGEQVAPTMDEVAPAAALCHGREHRPW